LEIEDWDVDRVDLKWAAPKNDGGAPITGYVIERKEKLHSSWDEVLTTNVSTNHVIRRRFLALNKITIGNN